MKNTSKAITLAAIAVVTLASGILAQSPPQYTVIDLETLGGASGATGINDSGQVVGSFSIIGSETHAFLYSSGKMTDLGTLVLPYSYATGINNSGQVVGFAGVTDVTYLSYHAFLYSSGKMTDLGTLWWPGQRCL